MRFNHCHPEHLPVILSEAKDLALRPRGRRQMLRFAQHDRSRSLKFWNDGHSRRGFSIVELLVVLAILVILASIFIPYLGTVRESERRVRCADNLRLIMQ